MVHILTNIVKSTVRCLVPGDLVYGVYIGRFGIVLSMCKLPDVVNGPYCQNFFKVIILSSSNDQSFKVCHNDWVAEGPVNIVTT